MSRSYTRAEPDARRQSLIEAAARIEMRFSEIQVLREQLKQEEYLIHEDLQRA